MIIMKNLLRKEIEKTAREANLTELEVITAMQTISAANNDEATLEILCELKYDYIKL
jgi:hypothetical protein